MKFVLLWSDVLIFMLVIALVSFFYTLRNDPQLSERWRQVFGNRLGMISFVIMACYIAIALLDSVHFRYALDPVEGQASDIVSYDNRVHSLLDVGMGNMGELHERTYSAPFALISFEKQNMKDANGNDIRDFPPLLHAGKHLTQPSDRGQDILQQSLLALFAGVLISLVVIAPQWWWLRHSDLPWHAAWAISTVSIMCWAPIWAALTFSTKLSKAFAPACYWVRWRR